MTTLKDLHTALEDTFTLYRQTHLAHWNVRGPWFPQLHAMFEEQYTELWEALDVLAERIRALGGLVEPAALAGAPTPLPDDALAMVQELASGHRALTESLQAMESQASDASDPGSADLFTERIRAHDQAAWMLESLAA